MDFKTPGQHRTVEAFRAHLRSIDDSMDCDPELPADGPLAQPVRFAAESRAAEAPAEPAAEPDNLPDGPSLDSQPAGRGADLGREVAQHTSPLAGRVIGNRWAIQPMEGWDGRADGRPSEHTLRRWSRFGQSGAKLIWGGEAFAVQEDGRANPGQLHLNPRADVAGGLAELRAAVRQQHRAIGDSTHDLLIGLQLTHSGRFSNPAGTPRPRIAFHHPLLDRRVGIDAAYPVLTDGELEGIGENIVQAARLAWNLGFDFVDVKCCHGYLLHEVLGGHTRRGSYGGSFENRTRLFARIVNDVRRECPGLEIGVRVSIVDSIPYAAHPLTRRGEPAKWDSSRPYEFGFGVDVRRPVRPDFDEPLRFLALVRGLGIRLVNITLGSPYYCPHIQRPAAYPPSDGYLPPEDPLRGVVRHLEAVRRCKAAFPDLLLVGSGYSYLQEYLPHVAQHEVRSGHVDFVGLGRMVLTYPEMPKDVLRGRPVQRTRICRTFSDCTTAPRNGLVSGCYPLDPYYKSSREAVKLHAIKRRIRDGQAGEQSRSTEPSSS